MVGILCAVFVFPGDRLYDDRNLFEDMFSEQSFELGQDAFDLALCRARSHYNFCVTPKYDENTWSMAAIIEYLNQQEILSRVGTQDPREDRQPLPCVLS